MPTDDAQRVVAGACHLSPALGERMLATKLSEHSVFLRELLPQDLKFEIENLSLIEAVKVAEFPATVTGQAHARQTDRKTRRSWARGARAQPLQEARRAFVAVEERGAFVGPARREYLERCGKHIHPVGG